MGVMTNFRASDMPGAQPTVEVKAPAKVAPKKVAPKVVEAVVEEPVVEKVVVETPADEVADEA